MTDTIPVVVFSFGTDPNQPPSSSEVGWLVDYVALLCALEWMLLWVRCSILSAALSSCHVCLLLAAGG